jgi:hypothetical protein
MPDEKHAVFRLSRVTIRRYSTRPDATHPLRPQSGSCFQASLRDAKDGAPSLITGAKAQVSSRLFATINSRHYFIFP